MKLSNMAVNRPVTTVMVVLIIVILGAVSLSRLSVDLFPDLTLPVAVAYVTYEGVGPQEMESLVTKPLEEALSTVNNVESVSSTSMMGMSFVTVEFNWGTDMDFATLQMREKIDMVKSMLPDDASDPVVFKFDPSLMPIMVFGVSGGNDMAELREIGEDEISDLLERLDGVAAVDVYGGLEREISIIMDPAKLNGYGLSYDQIVAVLRSENMNLPGGKVEEGRKEYIVRTVGEFESLNDIKKIIIPTQTGFIHLEDVAEVKESYNDDTGYGKAFMDGEPNITVVVQKQATANTVEVARRVKKALDGFVRENPDLELNYVFNQADFIQRSINNLINTAIFGAFLAVAVLYIFLRNFRTTLIISIAIPVSIIATFTLMYFGNLTMNMMTLGGLALGVGMLVDSSIVVLENIYRYRQEGYSRIEAASEGSSEVGTAVTASTLTTVAVFLPIVFVEGLAARLFRELALTVSFSLFSSLFVALTLIPMLSSKILKVSRDSNNGNDNGGKSFLDRVFKKAEQLFNSVENRYRNLLIWSLGHRKLIVLITVVSFIGSIALVPFIGAEFIPKMDEGMINVDIKLPVGSVMDETHKVAQEIENRIRKIPEIDTIFTSIGFTDSMMSVSSGPEIGRLTLNLIDKDEREKSSDEVAEEIRQLVKDIPGADIEVSAQAGMTGQALLSGAPVSIKIKGNDLDVLRELTGKVSKIVKNVEGIREVNSSFEEGRPEVQIVVNREKAALYGLGVPQVALAIQTAIKGQVATRYKVEGTEIDVKVQLDEDFRENISDLENIYLKTPLGIQVPLSEVAELVKTKGPTHINRENQVRTATVTANISGRDLKSISDDISIGLSKLDLPEGYTVEFGGEQKEMVEAFGDLLLAFGLAVILVYMILASQFESLLHPFAIMFSVPMALTGAFLGLFVTGRTINVPAFIGIIMLAGIVVNNAIVLVDYINTLRRRGMDRNEAITKAGPVRLRPILMTALTTILALLPLALGIGEGSEVRAPMATVVIGGLTLSTLLTLVVVPVFYSILDDIGNRVVRRFRRDKLNFKEGEKQLC
ncbi:MAG: hydrophobic/amphiphilic exporter (mainly bacteria), family [Thermosediminibacterales bacterium]|nr:hydrophobic/amphiphilic exporter (mainly bacteria), family [Thermosediminibacterales bacterium]MDK2836360.1 hydrophobic/amphiphilic exporter (mainly bacteria), family [Thermosediminibacterales bacterium]